MFKYGNLYIKKRTFCEWVTVFIIVMPFLLPTLLQLFSLPSVLKYSVDVAWILGFFVLFFRKNIKLHQNLVPFVACVLTFFAFELIIYFINFQSFIYFLWGMRNNFRFYVAFIMFALFLQEDDIETAFKFFDILFWINALVTAVQYFVLSYSWDYLGGIFGVEVGANASTLIFLTIVVTKKVLDYMNGKVGAVPCFATCSVALLIAVLAELKLFFIICLMIVVLAAVLTKFSWRKAVLLGLVALFVFLTGALLPVLFGENSNITFARIVELITAENYSSTKDLGRLTAIPTIAETLLTTWPKRIFGLGLGNCDTSSFAICNTPFYQTYSYLNYNWFSTAFTFLETGYIGLIFNFVIFAICFWRANKNIKNNVGLLNMNQVALIISIICVVIFIYNSSLRTEAGYVMYFVLALPFIALDKKPTEKE